MVIIPSPAGTIRTTTNATAATTKSNTGVNEGKDRKRRRMVRHKK